MPDGGGAVSDVVLILELDEYERDLLVCALQRWRREIAPEYKPAVVAFWAWLMR